MARDFYTSLFLGKSFKVVPSNEEWPQGMVSNDWRAIVNMYRTLDKLGIPQDQLRLDYEPCDLDEEGNPTRIEITKVVRISTNREAL